MSHITGTTAGRDLTAASSGTVSSDGYVRDGIKGHSSMICLSLEKRTELGLSVINLKDILRHKDLSKFDICSIQIEENDVKSDKNDERTQQKRHYA